jgi:uncharacterized tellurite resistance protein B-like protein
MLRALERLMKGLFPPDPAGDPAAGEHALQLATAVLLIEVMRADPKPGDAEKPAVLRALREKFALDDAELANLYELAEQRSLGAHDLYTFTERLNAAFSESQRIRVFELLWSVAYADGHLDSHETHLMRRLADLLHVRHAAAIGAKLSAQQRAGAPP